MDSFLLLTEFSDRVIKDVLGEHVNAQVCAWHMKLDIKKKLGQLACWPELKERLEELRTSLTVELFDQRRAAIYADFQDRGTPADPNLVIHYLSREWIPIAHRWALCYCNKSINLGKKSTQGSESMNSQFKRRQAEVTSLQVRLLSTRSFLLVEDYYISSVPL